MVEVSILLKVLLGILLISSFLEGFHLGVCVCFLPFKFGSEVYTCVFDFECFNDGRIFQHEVGVCGFFLLGLEVRNTLMFDFECFNYGRIFLHEVGDASFC